MLVPELLLFDWREHSLTQFGAEPLLPDYYSNLRVEYSFDKRVGMLTFTDNMKA